MPVTPSPRFCALFSFFIFFSCENAWLSAREKLRSSVLVYATYEKIGVSMIAVHGRQKERTRHKGPADLKMIAKIKACARVPIVSNGNIRVPSDIPKAFQITKCDGVMSATGILRNPRLFHNVPLNVPSPSPSQKFFAQPGGSIGIGCKESSPIYPLNVRDAVNVDHERHLRTWISLDTVCYAKGERDALSEFPQWGWQVGPLHTDSLGASLKSSTPSIHPTDPASNATLTATRDQPQTTPNPYTWVGRSPS